MSYLDQIYRVQRSAGENPIMISTVSPCAIGTELAAIASSAPASVSAGTANRAWYIPFHLVTPITAVKLWTYNGGTAAGNIDIAIYRSDFTKLVSSGAVAQSGTNVLQAYDITDTSIPVGRNYIGVSPSSSTATFFGWSASQIAEWQAMGVQSEAAAHPLPATATPVAELSTKIFWVGLSATTVVV